MICVPRAAPISVSAARADSQRAGSRASDTRTRNAKNVPRCAHDAHRLVGDGFAGLVVLHDLGQLVDGLVRARAPARREQMRADERCCVSVRERARVPAPAAPASSSSPGEPS
jgi:hypothetical protein